MKMSSGVRWALVLLAVLPVPGVAQAVPGRVVWHDLVTRDLAISKAFYAGMFGWTWRAPSEGKDITYVVAEMAGVAMAGLAESREKGSGSQWITYFSVNDIHRSVKMATDSGAKVVVAPTTTGSWHDQSALLTDPEGAAFALMKPGAEPVDSAGSMINGWLWVELWARNADSAADFYRQLLDYERRKVTVGGQPYSLLQTGREAVPTAGLLTIPVKEVQPNWLPTIRVADLNAMVARAVSLGGRVILAPRPDMRNGTIAIIGDPTGAALTLQQWDGTIAVGAR
jgi:predicted enzyme related to lactoylglutathione lyase